MQISLSFLFCFIYLLLFHWIYNGFFRFPTLFELYLFPGFWKHIYICTLYFIFIFLGIIQFSPFVVNAKLNIFCAQCICECTALFTIRYRFIHSKSVENTNFLLEIMARGIQLFYYFCSKSLEADRNPGVTNLSVSNTLYAVETPRTLMLTKLLSPESDPEIQRKATHTHARLALGKSHTNTALNVLSRLKISQ